MHSHELVSIKTISLEEYSVALRNVGLCAVELTDSGCLKLLGGRDVQRVRSAYEISEPVFSVHFSDDYWIAAIQDMTTAEDRNVSRKCRSFAEAIEFICSTHLQNSSRLKASVQQ